MSYYFGRDLRVARRRSALTQSDCAHLLGVDQPLISRLEAGKQNPTVEQLALLHLIFDRSFHSLSLDIIGSVRQIIEARLHSIPPCPATWPDRSHREHTLGRIAEKLAGLDEAYE